METTFRPNLLSIKVESNPIFSAEAVLLALLVVVVIVISIPTIHIHIVAAVVLPIMAAVVAAADIVDAMLAMGATTQIRVPALECSG